MWLILVLYAFFGSSFPISKVLLRYVHPIFLTGVRMTIAGTLLLAYQYFYAHQDFRFKKKHLKYFAQYAFLGVYLTYILRFWALHRMPAAKTSFFFNLTPFFSAFYSYYMFNERLTKQQWIGLSIGFLGFLPILLSSSSKEQLLGEFMFISWPEIAVFSAVAFSSYSWMVMRKLIRGKSYAPATVNGICMLAGGLLALPTSFFFETWQPIADPGVFISWLALIIIISNIVCHNLYAYLLNRYSATFLAFSGFLGPLFAAFYGWIFLNERVGWHFFLSAVFVFVGLYLFYQHELQSEAITK